MAAGVSAGAAAASATTVAVPEDAEVVPFTAETRLSGIRVGGASIMKGAVDAIGATATGPVPPDLREQADGIAHEGSTDGVVAEAKPEDKITIIRQEQALGELVAMTGDGTNDAPALAQADVGLAMNSGTQAAKEAANMVDLDSDPTKLIEVVMIGKQLLITRGAITTFSIADDVGTYFAIIPAMFVATYPDLGALNLMRLAAATSAIARLAAVALLVAQRRMHRAVRVSSTPVRCRQPSYMSLEGAADGRSPRSRQGQTVF